MDDILREARFKLRVAEDNPSAQRKLDLDWFVDTFRQLYHRSMACGPRSDLGANLSPVMPRVFLQQIEASVASGVATPQYLFILATDRVPYGRF